MISSTKDAIFENKNTGAIYFAGVKLAL